MRGVHFSQLLFGPCCANVGRRVLTLQGTHNPATFSYFWLLNRDGLSHELCCCR